MPLCFKFSHTGFAEDFKVKVVGPFSIMEFDHILNVVFGNLISREPQTCVSSCSLSFRLYLYCLDCVASYGMAWYGMLWC